MKYKYNGQWVDINIKALDSMPLGATILWPSNQNIPTGWMICDGTNLDKTVYPELFSVIGNLYGGTGANGFKIPDLRGRVPVGVKYGDTDFQTIATTGGYKGLQKHTHQSVELGGNTLTSWSSSGSGGIFNLASLFQSNQNNNNQVNTGGVNGNATDTGAEASKTNGNLQPYIVMNYIIKVTNTTPTMASVVNATNNSIEDTYSCDYENKHYGGTLLWQNSNISNEFTAQTLSFNDTYSSYDIIFAQDSGTLICERVYTGDSSVVYLLQNNYGGYFRTRAVQVNTNSLVFDKGQFFSSYHSAADNNYQCIPYKIIGYK